MTVSLSVTKLLYTSSGPQELAELTISEGAGKIQLGILKKRALNSQTATIAT